MIIFLWISTVYNRFRLLCFLLVFDFFFAIFVYWIKITIDLAKETISCSFLFIEILFKFKFLLTTHIQDRRILIFHLLLTYLNFIEN